MDPDADPGGPITYPQHWWPRWRICVLLVHSKNNSLWLVQTGVHGVARSMPTSAAVDRVAAKKGEILCSLNLLFFYLFAGCGSAFILSGSGSRSSILGWIPIRIQGFKDQKLEKSTAEKKKIFLSKTTIYLSLGLHKESPSYRRSLQLSKEAIQHFKTWTFQKNFYFCGSFLPSWIRIRIPNTDQDPLTRLNPDPIRIRIRIRNPAWFTFTCNSFPEQCFGFGGK